jgi:hypothetical protein
MATAQVEDLATATATTPLTPAMVVGRSTSAVAPLPDLTLCTCSPTRDRPVAQGPRTCAARHTRRALTLVKPGTMTGKALDDVVPLPSWPSPLFPQHHAVPSASDAQAWVKAVDSERMPVSPHHSRGGVRGRVRAVSELAIDVGSPTPCLAAAHDRAGVQRARGDQAGASEARYHGGHKTLERCSVTQLSIVVAAPTSHGAVPQRRTGVAGSCLDRGHIREPDGRDWRGLGGQGAIAQQTIASPTRD